MKEFINNVIRWSAERGIMEHSSAEKQVIKTLLL